MTNIVIFKPHEGNGFVVLDKFNKIDNDPTISRESKPQRLLRKLKKNLQLLSGKMPVYSWILTYLLTFRLVTRFRLLMKLPSLDPLGMFLVYGFVPMLKVSLVTSPLILESIDLAIQYI